MFFFFFFCFFSKTAEHVLAVELPVKSLTPVRFCMRVPVAPVSLLTGTVDVLIVVVASFPLLDNFGVGRVV